MKQKIFTLLFALAVSMSFAMANMITIDGDFSEWANVQAAEAKVDENAVLEELYDIKFCADADYIYFYMEYNGEEFEINEEGRKNTIGVLDIFLDTDGNAETGLAYWYWQNAGADILIEGGTDFDGDKEYWYPEGFKSLEFGTANWQWDGLDLGDGIKVSEIKSFNGHKALEGSIMRASLNNPTSLKVGVLTQGAGWSGEFGALPEMYIDAEGASVKSPMLDVPLDTKIYGSCGENLTWEWDADKETLTISGNGAMTDFASFDDRPWSSFAEKIKSVFIVDGVTSIGRYAFFNCSNLTSVTIPNSVTCIGERAFVSCKGLQSITIPNSVTIIGYKAFVDCKCLVSITIPNSVISIGDYSFWGCSNLTSINVATDNQNYTSLEGILFNKDITTIIEYPGGKQGAYVIPNSVTTIKSMAFCECRGLTSITIPDGVTVIGSNAFSECSSLNNVVIGLSVKILEENAFSNCSAIEVITCYSQRPPTVSQDALYGVNYSTIVYVPTEYVDTYKMHDFWGLYDVRPIGEGSGGETVSVTVNYQDKDGVAISNEPLTFHFPEIPEVEGFTFIGWQPVAEIINGSITIQAIYKSNDSSYSAPSVSIPGSSTQKLIREGNVYVLRDGKTYTVQGQEVR